MTVSATRVTKLLHLLLTTAFLATMTPHTPILAQTLNEGIEKEGEPVVKTRQTEAGREAGRIIEAIENIQQSAAEVRKIFSLDEMEIVFVPDIGKAGEEIDAAIVKHEQDIADLRQAIEASAIFYNALEAHQILPKNVVALEIAGNGAITLFVDAEDPER